VTEQNQLGFRLRFLVRPNGVGEILGHIICGFVPPRVHQRIEAQDEAFIRHLPGDFAVLEQG
jgi:hypothetical protein